MMQSFCVQEREEKPFLDAKDGNTGGAVSHSTTKRSCQKAVMRQMAVVRTW